MLSQLSFSPGGSRASNDKSLLPVILQPWHLRESIPDYRHGVPAGWHTNKPPNHLRTCSCRPDNVMFTFAVCCLVWLCGVATYIYWRGYSYLFTTHPPNTGYEHYNHPTESRHSRVNYSKLWRTDNVAQKSRLLVRLLGAGKAVVI